MPPNHKNTGLFTSNAEYESLKIPIQSKYLPLTDSRSEVVTATSTAHAAPAKVQQQHHQTKLKDEVVSIQQPVAVVVEEEEDLTYSYWDIPSDIPVEEEKEEVIDDLFSLTHIESNLITDSIIIKNLEEESTTTILKQQQEPVSYWTWSNDTDKDWNDTYYDNTIESKLVSVSTPDKHCEDCCQDYWAWEPSSAVVDVDESDYNDYRDEGVDVVMMMAATTTKSTTSNSNNDDIDRRKQLGIRNVLTKSWRKHKHLAEPEQPATACTTTKASTSEHYWHWQEFHSKSCSSQ
jgi:hypothetical protein